MHQRHRRGWRCRGRSGDLLDLLDGHGYRDREIAGGQHDVEGGAVLGQLRSVGGVEVGGYIGCHHRRGALYQAGRLFAGPLGDVGGGELYEHYRAVSQTQVLPGIRVGQEFEGLSQARGLDWRSHY